MHTIELTGIPTFHINDYEKAVAFYVDFLGFSIDWEHRFGETAPVYMQVSKYGLALHLSENERFPPGMIVFVATKGLADYYSELSGKKSKFQVPSITATPWQTMQLELTDPFGNLLRFNEPC